MAALIRWTCLRVNALPTASMNRWWLIVKLPLLGPLQNALEDGASGDEVALGLALPREAAFDSVEAVLLAGGQFVVKEAFALLQLQAERLPEA